MSKVNILLVDDHPANLLALEAILERLGENLVRARSGEEALRRLQQEEFAVILLDVQMPGMDGFETAEFIRAREKTRHTPIIFLTAYEDNRLSAEEAYKLGAVDYLIKPLVPVILRAKVAGFIDLFRKKEEIGRQAEQLRQLERREFERKLAEENARLRESEGRFRLMADAAPVLIWMGGTDRRWHWFNRPWLDFVGRSMEQERGNGWAEGIHPDDLDRCLRTYTGAFDARQPFTTEYRLRRHDGEYRWVLANGTPLHGPGGEFTGYIGSCVDITDRKATEEALKESDRRKDEFLAILAHELRNPLASIHNGLALMKRAGGGGGAAEEARSQMERQVQQLVRLIEDLLDVSRIARGRLELRKGRIGLAEVVGNALEETRPFLASCGHGLTVELPEGPIALDADPTRLAQVFANLLNNAAKYTDPGGRIWLTAERRGGEVVVRVRDTGIGIAAEMLPRIFEKFTQVDTSLGRSRGGLGIGLTLAKQLVEGHGGAIEARSDGPGRGSEFVVRLPVAVGPPASGPQPPGGVERAASPIRRRILIVDDNRVAATMLDEVLRLVGHEVRTVHDGEEAVGEAEVFRPDVILLDIGLPGLDGYDVARRVRRQPWGREVVLIVLTGWSQEEYRRRSEEAGIDHHLVKPVDPEGLIELLAGLGARG